MSYMCDADKYIIDCRYYAKIEKEKVHTMHMYLIQLKITIII